MQIYTIDELIAKRKRVWKEKKSLEWDKNFHKSIVAIMKKNALFRRHIRFECRQDSRKAIELFFTVQTKDKGNAPFFLTPEQHKLADTILRIEREYSEGKRTSQEIMILKARQLGFTTLITAIQLAKLIFDKNFKGYTLTHDAAATRKIFRDKARAVMEALPKYLIPTFLNNNAHELATNSKANSSGNSWVTGTAGSKDPGRSGTFNFLHQSERAFYEYPETLDASLKGTFVKSGLNIIETTANGFNHLKDLYDEIIEGNSNYVLLFFPWYTNAEYEFNFESDLHEEEFKNAVKQGTRYKGVDSKFMKLLYSYLLNIPEMTWNKLYWYFKKRQDLKDKVFQEYPTTADEAFLASGRPHFDIEILNILLVEAPEPLSSDVLPDWGLKDEFEFYELPKPGVFYVIGADVAEGKDKGDKSSFTVIRTDTYKEVACYEGTIKPDDYGHLLATVGMFYNFALIAPERNNHGHSVINTLENQEYYMNLYVEQTFGKTQDHETGDYGWITTEKSKYKMLDELDSAIRKGRYKPQSKKTLQQMRTVQIEDGKISVNGKDRVVGTAIAWQVRDEKPVSLFGGVIGGA